MSEPTQIYNLKDVAHRRRLMETVQRLPPGLYEVTIKPRKLTRSLNQNAYWHAGVVEPFRYWLSEINGEDVTHDQAHDVLKRQMLGTKDVVLPTGDVIEIPPSTRTLDTAEFADLIERTARWLAEFAGVVIIPSEMFLDAKAS